MTYRKKKTQEKKNHLWLENNKLKEKWYKILTYIIYYVTNLYELCASYLNLYQIYPKLDFAYIFYNLLLFILIVLSLEYFISKSIKFKKEFIMKFFDILILFHILFFIFLYLSDIINKLNQILELTLKNYFDHKEIAWNNLFITTYLAVTGIIIMIIMNLKILIKNNYQNCSQILKRLVILILIETIIFFSSLLVSSKYSNFKTSSSYYLFNTFIYLSVIIFLSILVCRNDSEEKILKVKIMYILFLKFTTLFFMLDKFIIKEVEVYLSKKLTHNYKSLTQ